MNQLKERLPSSSQVVAENSPIESVGLDIGNGVTKIVFSGQEARVPSYFLGIQSDRLYDLPVPLNGGYVAYAEGDRSDLVGTQWLAGQPAYQRDPVAALRVVDDPEGKIRYALQLFLGGVATLPYAPHRTFNLVASVHHEKALGERLTEALGGVHRVNFGGKESTITIRVLRTLQEGSGVIVSTGYPTDSQVLVFDFGSGTTIISVFGARGKLLDRAVLSGGVEDLIDGIARNLDTVRQLYQEGDRQIIRAGIEDGTFQYGTTGWSFKSIYESELKTWVVSKLKPALKAGSKHFPTSNYIIAVGGGSQLPIIGELLLQKGITPVRDGAWSNARGLHRLSVLLGRGV